MDKQEGLVEAEVVEEENQEASETDASGNADPFNALDVRKIADILLRQDYSKLTPAEQISFIKYKCDRVGVDITTNPFVFIPAPTRDDPNRKLLINTKNLYAFLVFKYALKISVDKIQIVSILGKNYYEATATAKIPNTGAEDTNVGVVFVDKAMKPVEIANLRMKAVTKAKCRAIHTVVGVGGMSYAEAEDLGTIPAIQSRPHSTKLLVRKK